MPYDTWFPTTVYWEDFDVPASLRADVLSAIRELAGPPPDSEAYKVTNFTAPHTLHMDPRVQPLFELFQPRLREFFHETLGIHAENVQLFVGRCWPVIQVGKIGGGVHNHAGAMFSAVFYLVIPEGAGQLEILKPFDAATDCLDRSKYTSLTYTKAVYKVRENLLVMFDSNLKHLSVGNTGPGERIALAFDIYATSAITVRGSGTPRGEYMLRLI